jgi:tetratricopeptide (TPR) repeat protein
LIAKKYHETIGKFQSLTPEELKIEEPVINALGVQSLKERNEAAALAFFLIQKEKYPSSSTAHECLGKAYIYTNDRTQALDALSRAVNLNPKNQNAQLILSRLQIPEDVAFESQDNVSLYLQIPGSYSFKGLGDINFYRCGGTLWLRASSNVQTPTRIHPLNQGSLSFQFNSEGDAGRLEVQFIPDEQGRIKSCRFKMEKNKIDALGTKIS